MPDNALRVLTVVKEAAYGKGSEKKGGRQRRDVCSLGRTNKKIKRKCWGEGKKDDQEFQVILKVAVQLVSTTVKTSSDEFLRCRPGVRALMSRCGNKLGSNRGKRLRRG